MTIHKLNRRKFLAAGTGVAMGITLLPHKSMAAEEKKMNLYSWDSYLGDNTLADFNKATGIEAKIDLYGSNDELFAKLKAGKQAVFIIFQTEEAGIGIPISLNGFDKAVAVLN